MEEYSVTLNCLRCNGTGIIELEVDKPIDCPDCEGDGVLSEGELKDLHNDIAEIKDKVDDILDKCNDIFEKVNE